MPAEWLVPIYFIGDGSMVITDPGWCHKHGQENERFPIFIGYDIDPAKRP